MPDAAYMREWRKTEAGQTAIKRQQAMARARSRASKALQEMYPVMWSTLLRRAMEDEGITDS